MCTVVQCSLQLHKCTTDPNQFMIVWKYNHSLILSSLLLVHTQLSDHMTIYTDLIHSLSNWISKCAKIVIKLFKWFIAPIVHAFRMGEKQSKYLLSSLIQEVFIISLVNASSPTKLSWSTALGQLSSYLAVLVLLF